ncbi:MAG: radical SAM protein, partial [Candidatus Nanoarchaeia archaeon]|nr:B12-binding domain-containing radical SAM protein [Candidatus Jingweiarchaeum tengchongense]
MKVLLAFPPILPEERYGKLAESGTYLPPLGLAYIASVLQARGFDVEIIDGSVLSLSIHEFCREIERRNPSILGISVITPTLTKSIKIAEILKRNLKDLKIIFGGPHVSIDPVGTLEKCDAVDITVFGEAEYTILDIVRGRNLKEIEGICYRENKKIKKNRNRAFIENLDSLPFPARHLLPMEKYRPSHLHYKKLPATNVMVGRGCPFECTFCSKSVFGRTLRLRNVSNVIDEIKHLIEKYGVKEIMFWDDVFTLNKKWVREFCSLLLEEKIDIIWSCWTRVDCVDEKLLKLMKRAGCWHISYGIESGEQRILDKIKKGFKVQQIVKAFKITHKVGIETRATAILGLPGDTEETIMKTINFMIKLNPDYMDYLFLCPYPNTEIEEQCKVDGKIIEKDLSKYTDWYPIFVPHTLSEKRLIELM